MNALVGVKPIDHELLAWLVENAGSSCRVVDVARRFRWSEAYASIRVKNLRLTGLVELGRGSCEPTGLGVARVRAHQKLATPASAEADHATAAPGRVVEVAPLSGTGRREAGDGLKAVAMETRVSIDPPPDALIDALAGFQDELLQRANAQLRLEVTELRARIAVLEARQAKTLLLLAAAADAITTG